MIRPENFEVRQCNPGFYGTREEDCMKYKIRTNNRWEPDSEEVCACETCASQDDPVKYVSQYKEKAEIEYVHHDDICQDPECVLSQRPNR